jgi:2,4-dienoyl-CoA reductase-like NADH-dependent reductase (Old Yellow Enzyme family)/thioredoxin reductase
MALDDVLSPIEINGLEIKNRVVRTAHGTNLGGGSLSDDLIAYHEARAKGGVGLSMLEASGVHWSGPMTLNVWDDSIIPRYKLLMEKVRPHRMAMFSQLNHLGYDLGPPGQRPWSASETVSPGMGVMAHAMTGDEISEVVGSFAQAARRAVEGGLNGVEVHCAHGFLLQQFVSPATNQRTDEYGGDLEGRMRFFLEVMRAIRKIVGPSFVLGARLGPQNFPGGLNVDEHIDIANRLLAENVIDYLNVSHGSSFNAHKIIGGMHEDTGYEVPMAREITRLTELPTLVTGRFRTLADADKIIAQGDADLVGMTRAHLADPDIVRKTVAGRADEVRPCIGCNQGCVGGLNLGRIGCTVNVAAGHELRMDEALLEKAEKSKSVLVIGGGPAGMETARIAALRGHVVTLAETSDQLGGSLRVARLAPKHESVGDIADWLEAEMIRRGVTVELNRRVDRAYIAKLSPDAVVLAAGASPRMDGRQKSRPDIDVVGVGQDHVVSTETLLMRRHNQVGRTALVFDDVGAYEAIGAAEFMIGQGAEVTFVTSLGGFAPRMESNLAARPALERLNAGGKFRLITRAYISEIGADSVTIQSLDGAPPQTASAETVALVTLNRPNIDLLSDIRALGIDAHVVGDANHPNFLPSAFAEGNAAGRAV